jgi:hypothetical protein
VRFFTVLDFQHLMLALFLGLVAALVIYLGLRSGRYRGRRGTELPPSESGYPDGIEARDNPVPPVLIFIYLGFAVWFIFYVIFFGLKGGPL